MSVTPDTQLRSWNDGAARQAIEDFVEAATALPPEERIAVFDNDGTLWCEKPMPIELGFILERFAQMAERDATLRERQPWKAACEKDYAWLGGAMTKHYAGDETDVKVLIGGLIQAFAGWTVDEYGAAASEFLHAGTHPTLGLGYLDLAYLPMIELLRHLEANGFTNYIASGGDRDFMRPVSRQVYGIPPEHVIGSTNALRWREDEQGGAIAYEAKPDFFDDGPVKPVRIWSRVGARPLAAAGNSNGDVPMLRFAGGPSRPALRLLILHDDAQREFDYTAGAEKALDRAAADGWTVVSIKDDWAGVFG